MGCATGTIRYTLFFFNTLWAILGILVILFGGLGWDAMPQKYAIGLIILGSVIFLVSFFGCFGAIRQSTRLLWTYSICLLVLVILIVAFIFLSTPEVFKKYALQGVNDLWNQEIEHPGAMDTIQKTYACCGRNAADDYIDIHRVPPSSCCKENNCFNPLNLYVTGCLTKVENAFADEAVFTSYCEWGLLIFTVVILLLSTMLAIHYTNRKRRYNY